MSWFHWLDEGDLRWLWVSVGGGIVSLIGRWARRREQDRLLRQLVTAAVAWRAKRAELLSKRWGSADPDPELLAQYTALSGDLEDATEAVEQALS